MCGIVCYLGPGNGLQPVLQALALLAYRAPDSTGVALIDDSGRFAIRRSVGDSTSLQAKLAADPLPASHPYPIVVGHGRWAMVGPVSEANAHPITDHSQSRLVAENGSHNARLMLGLWAEQEAWWQRRGLPGPIHRTENSTEAIAWEWERLAIALEEGEPPEGSAPFLARLDAAGIADREERALRLALWRVRAGNTHACALYSRLRPRVLYLSSHHKPLALARRATDPRPALMVASDINAALLLWPWEEVAGAGPEARFTVETLFLDSHLDGGRELLARLEARPEGLDIRLSHYDGTPLPLAWQPVSLSPALADRRGYPSFTECAIAEIPEVVDRVTASGVRGLPALPRERLGHYFGPTLGRLRRLLLIGEGSSWRDGLAAAPLFRALLPDLAVELFRPVEILNLAPPLDPAGDLAVEISWSGTTDSLLQADDWLHELGLPRLALTGRPQSDLARRTASSAGSLNVLSGPERSVATVKGFQAILHTLAWLALHLAELRQGAPSPLARELAGTLPGHIRAAVEDGQRRAALRRLGARCAHFYKVAVVGNSPIVLEAGLKIEELAQVVAAPFPFGDDCLPPLLAGHRQSGRKAGGLLWVINATSAAECRQADSLIRALAKAGQQAIVQALPGPETAAWADLPGVALFTVPAVAPPLQPLLDAPFFFDLAVALAYGRGLSPAQIDRPRNLAKSVTTTAAERRGKVEGRADYAAPDLAAFAAAGDRAAGDRVAAATPPLVAAWLATLPDGYTQIDRPPEAHEALWQAAQNRLNALLAALLGDHELAQAVRLALAPLLAAGYDKAQVIGGGQDYQAARQIARALCRHGVLAEPLYTDSAWHGPLAAVGGPDAAHDALILVLATDPLFQATALVDTQVYRARGAQVFLVLPAGAELAVAVQGVDAQALFTLPAVPRPFLPLVGAAFGQVLAQQWAGAGE